jgi:hypothetical protein
MNGKSAPQGTPRPGPSLVPAPYPRKELLMRSAIGEKAVRKVFGGKKKPLPKKEKKPVVMTFDKVRPSAMPDEETMSNSLRIDKHTGSFNPEKPFVISGQEGRPNYYLQDEKFFDPDTWEIVEL